MREGETVFISAATGAVGSVAGAARQGARLPRDRQRGRAGEGRASRWRSSATTPCFDYRADDPREALAEGIDVYFDNVGGPQLEAAIGAMRQRRPDRRLRRGLAVQRDRARRPARATSSCSSASASTCAASSSATTTARCGRVPRGGRRADRRRPAEARRDGGRRRPGGRPARVHRHAARALPRQGGRRAVKRSAGVLLRRGGRARAARPPGRAVLGAQGRRRVVDPQGRARRGRGARGLRAARVPRGARRRGAAALVDLGTVRQKNRKEVRAFYGEGELDVGGRRLQHVRDGVAAALGPDAVVPGDRPRRVVLRSRSPARS